MNSYTLSDISGLFLVKRVVLMIFVLFEEFLAITYQLL